MTVIRAPDNQRIAKGMSRTVGVLVFSTVVSGLALFSYQMVADPDYATSALVGFFVIYGWLVSFFICATVWQRRGFFLLLIGGVPLALAAVVSFVFSYPFHLIPLAIYLIALGKYPRENS